MVGAVDGRGFVFVARRAAGHPEHLAVAVRGRRGRRRRSAGDGVGLVMAMPSDAEQPLLQVAVGGERARVHDAVDAPVHHDRDMVRHRGRDADVLLHDENGEVFLAGETDQKIAHLRDDHRREPFGRLVHHEQTRGAEQRARDRQHLLLSARQLPAAVAAPLREPRKNLVNPLDGPGAAGARAESQGLVDRKARPQATSLRHIAHALPSDQMRLEADQVAPIEANGARTHRHEADDRVAEGGLAHAVASDHREDAALEGQRDALQGMRFAVVDLKILDLQDRLRRRGRVPSHAPLRDRSPEPRRRPRSPAARLP